MKDLPRIYTDLHGLGQDELCHRDTEFTEFLIGFNNPDGVKDRLKNNLLISRSFILLEIKNI